MSDIPDLGFCRAQSIDQHEPIYGSAVADTTVIVALQHDGPWGSKAVPESDLPAAVKARLLAWENEVPGVRVQLIRRDRALAGRTLLVACTELERARAVQIQLEGPDDLVPLDLPAIVAALRAGDPVAGAEVVDRPQVLVCTNGKRDRCCAKWGLPLHRALAEMHGVDAWQTTHLGGHRFAATLLWLPAGICLGRVEVEEAEELAAAIARGEIHRLDRLRGRVSLGAAEQAAESIWRERTGERRVDALASIAAEDIGLNAWRVRLRDREGAEHVVELSREATGAVAQPSCGKPPEPVMRWRVES